MSDAWRSELLTERIRDLNGVPFVVAGNAYRNYGAPNAQVHDLIKEAIRALEAGELDRCERICLLAERAQIVGIRELCCG